MASSVYGRRPGFHDCHHGTSRSRKKHRGTDRGRQLRQLRSPCWWQDFHHYIRRGYIAPWRAESEHQNKVVIDSTAVATSSYALGGYLVVVEGIIGPWFVERWLSHVQDELPVHYIILRPSEGVALRHAAERTDHTDLIDPDPVTFMHQEIQRTRRS